MRRLAFLPIISALFLGCGQNDTLLAGGSSSEVPNALTGTATDPSGWPVAGAKVTLRPVDYAPGMTSSKDTTTTDSNGRWSFPLTRGAWNLELKKGDDGWISQINTWEGDHVSRHDTLRQNGWIRGRIGLATATAPRVWIAGTDHQAKCDSNGAFLLGPVPPATLRLVTQVDSAGIPLTSIHEVTPASGDTLELGDLKGDSWNGEDYSLWPSSRTAIVDFTASGASGTGDHAHFPVFVRLDSILDPAKVDREELRFDDGAGLHLPFEIETWDTLTHKAEVWVRLDTANGSSKKHLLRTFWGRKRGLPAGSPEVFGAEDGYLGAWHSPVSMTTSRMRFESVTAADGVAGKGFHFDGTSSLRMDSLGSGSEWTIGFWLRPTAKPSGEIVLIGVDTLADSLRWSVSLRDDLFVRVWSGGSPDKEVVSPTALPLNQWTWVSASFDGASSRLSLVVDTTALPRVTVKMPRASQLPLTGMRAFVGDLDELRLVDTTRDRQWQQLEGQTSRPGIPWIRWM